MYSLIFTEKFEKSFSKLNDNQITKQVWNKILELERRAPIGKKLRNSPFWSIHINKYRVIYQMHGIEIVVIDIIQRKFDYREL